MPTTPVGGLPYPLGTDKPLIPTDMKALADTADSWVSGLDSAFGARVSAVGTRLDAVAARLATTSANLVSANSLMTAGDTAITSAQNALSAVESRLASQDTAANALQTRYTTDSTNLTNFSTRTPLGVTKVIGRSSTTSSSSTTQFWLNSSVYNIGLAANPQFRVSFSVTFKANNSNTGWVEFRICAGVGTSGNPAWGSYFAQASYTSPVDLNPQPFIMTANVYPGAVSSSGAIIALGCVGDGTLNYSVNINSGSIQYLTTG